MGTAAIPGQTKAALVLVSILVFLKLSLLKTAMYAGAKAFVTTRSLLVTPLTVTICLLVLTWVCWATWRTSRTDSDVRALLILLISVDAFLFLLVFFIERFA